MVSVNETDPESSVRLSEKPLKYVFHHFLLHFSSFVRLRFIDFPHIANSVYVCL